MGRTKLSKQTQPVPPIYQSRWKAARITTTSSTPVDGEEDRGAHGPLDQQAHAHSLQTSLTKNRRLAGSVAVGVGLAATGAALLRKR